MSTIFLVVHVCTAVFIILMVMLQTGKGSEIGASFGAGGSNTLLGASGAGNILTKLTSWAAAIFMVTSLGLAWFQSHQRKSSIFDDKNVPISKVPQTAPVAAPPAATVPAAASEAKPSEQAPVEQKK